MKIPLAEQIEAVRESVIYAHDSRRAECLDAAFATLKWVERHQAELRVLAEFPGVEIRVLNVTPSTHGVSATSQFRSVDRKSGLSEGGEE